MPPQEPKAPESQRRREQKHKRSFYFPSWMLEEIHAEAKRLDRTLSWTIHRAWKIARSEIKKMGGPDEGRGD